jgi:beta-lactamase class A
MGRLKRSLSLAFVFALMVGMLPFTTVAEITAEGTLQKRAVTTYQYGTHILVDDSGKTLYALQFNNPQMLDSLVGKRVRLFGSLVPGYPVSGGLPYLHVTRVTEIIPSSGGQPNPVPVGTPTPPEQQKPDCQSPSGCVPKERGTNPAAIARPAGSEPARTEERSAMGDQIDSLLDGRQGRYSVVVMTRDGTTRYSHLADEQLEAASLYKLGIMVEVYRQRETKGLEFSEQLYLDPAFFIEDYGEGFSVGDAVPVSELLEQMITVSSNVAAAALLHRVGAENVNATLRGMGMTNTEIRWTPFLEPGAGLYQEEPPGQEGEEDVYNVTSAADMARLFHRLLAGNVVSPEASADMLALLARQQLNDRLPAYLPPGTRVAHKTGNLVGIVHDAGVIYTPNGPMIVAVLTDNAVEGEAVQFIAALGEVVYRGVPGAVP